MLDERTNRRRVALPFDVTFRRSGAAVDLTVAGGAGAGWSISAHLVDGAAGRSAQLRVAGFDAARLSPDPGPPLPVALSLSAPIDAAGTLGRAEGEATVGAFDVDVDGAPARIDPGRFAVAFDPAARAFTLGPATLRSGGAQMRVRIEGRLPAPGDPTGAVRLTLAGDDVALADGFRTPALARLAANATYEARDRRLWIDRFTMGPAEGAPIVEGQLGLGLFGRSPEVRLAARAAGLDAAMVKAAWPPSLNRDLRGWSWTTSSPAGSTRPRSRWPSRTTGWRIAGRCATTCSAAATSSRRRSCARPRICRRSRDFLGPSSRPATPRASTHAAAP